MSPTVQVIVVTTYVLDVSHALLADILPHGKHIPLTKLLVPVHDLITDELVHSFAPRPHEVHVVPPVVPTIPLKKYPALQPLVWVESTL